MDAEGKRLGESTTAGPKSGIRTGGPGDRVRGALVREAPLLRPGRLFDVDRAAAYLSVSPWTVRDLEAAGTIERVRAPSETSRSVLRGATGRGARPARRRRLYRQAPCRGRCGRHDPA